MSTYVAFTPDDKSLTGTRGEVHAYTTGWERGFACAMRDRDIADAIGGIARSALWAGVCLAIALVPVGRPAAAAWLTAGVAWLGLLAWNAYDYRTLTRPRTED